MFTGSVLFGGIELRSLGDSAFGKFDWVGPILLVGALSDGIFPSFPSQAVQCCFHRLRDIFRRAVFVLAMIIHRLSDRELKEWGLVALKRDTRAWLANRLGTIRRNEASICRSVAERYCR